jgi:hypothetical protein
LQPILPPPSSSSILSSSPFSTILPNSATLNSMLCPEQRSDPHPPIVPRSHPPDVAATSFSSLQSSPVSRCWYEFRHYCGWCKAGLSECVVGVSQLKRTHRCGRY